MTRYFTNDEFTSKVNIKFIGIFKYLSEVTVIINVTNRYKYASRFAMTSHR